MNTIKIVFVAAPFFLSACMASGIQVSEQAALQFKEGVTTEKEIISKLGKPSGVGVMAGKKMLTYSGMQSRVNGATFIPIVGAFVGGSTYKISVAVYTINPNGVLEHITYSAHEGGARMGMNPAEMAESTPSAK